MTARGRTRCVLLAAGMGTRLRPLTETVPKCLVDIGGKPLLQYWLENLDRAGVRDVLVNTHHLRDSVRSYLNQARAQRGSDFNLLESYEPQLLGSAGTISANRAFMDGASECAIVYADNLSNVNLGDVLSFHRRHGDPFTMVLFRTSRPKECGIAALDGDMRVVEFVEKPADPASNLANAGIYVVSADAYREIADLRAFDFGFDVIPRFVGRMRGYLHEGYHRDIGHLDALAQARNDVRDVFGAGS